MAGSSGGGGGGGGKTQIPAYLRPYVVDMFNRATNVANQGYTPYMGPDVAAFAPQQVQAMQGAQDWYTQFEHPGQAAPDVASQLMPATDFGNGMKGYSSYPGYLQQLSALAAKYPGLSDYIKSMAIDPVTGKPGSRTSAGSGTTVGGGILGGTGGGTTPPTKPPFDWRTWLMEHHR